MSKFQFSMQKILDLKVKNREQEEWNYAIILKQLEDENKKLSSFIVAKKDLQQDIVHHQTAGTSIIELHQKQSYVQHLEQLIHNQTLHVNEVKDSLKVKQRELIELKIEEKKWTKLREKKYEEYRVESNKIEQKELDEIANHLIYK